jgi:protein-tyrosine phosphatase
MAEFVMRDLAEKAGRGAEFEIASTAVSTEEIWGNVGNPVYSPVRELLARKGISCAGKRAKLLTEADGERYDVFFCMDESNLRRAKRILGERNGKKCKKLMEVVGSLEDVADPWYTRDFEEAYDDIFRACSKILEET